MTLTPASPADRIFRFGPFELSERDGQLRKNGVRIKVQEQPFRILLELVANAGRMVTREELQQKLWLADTFVDFDVGLNTAIRKLRQALGDDADEPHYIETQARRGYRFVAPVTENAAAPQSMVAPDADTTLAPIGTATPKASSRRTWVWMAAAGCVIAVIAALAVWWIHRKSEIVEINPVTESGNVFRSAASRDGSYIAYVQSDAGKFNLYLMQVATGRVVPLLPGSPLAILNLHFSPDGNFIYFLRQLDESDALGVFRISTLGGPVARLAIDAQMRSVTVSPDGKQIAYIAQTPSESLIVAVDPEGANRRVLAKRPAALGFRYIEWSPSQDTMAAVAIVRQNMGIGLFRVELGSGSIRDLSISGWGTIGQPAWGPDGNEIYAPAVPSERLSPMMHIWEFDARTGAHKPLTSGSTQYQLSSLSSTAAGDLIANTKAPSLSLWATDAAGQPQRIPASRSEGRDSVVWVGNRIVAGTPFGIMVHDPDGRSATELRSHSSIYRLLARCGPGSVVYWASDARRQSHIARTDITSGATSTLTDGPRDNEPTCTPDGATLVFVHCAQGNRCFLTRKALDSGSSLSLYELNPNSEMDLFPTLSPDGTTVLFLKQPDAGDPNEEAMIIPIAGGEPKKLQLAFPDFEAVRWAPDGKSLFYVRNVDDIGNIWSAPMEGQPARKLTNFDSERIFSFDVSSDNRLVIARGTMTSDVVLIKMVK